MKTLPLIALLALASCAPKTGTVAVADIEPLQSAEVAPAALPTLAGLEFPGDALIPCTSAPITSPFVRRVGPSPKRAPRKGRHPTWQAGAAHSEAASPTPTPLDRTP